MRDPFDRSRLSAFGRRVLDCLAVERGSPYTEEQAYDAIRRHTSDEYETPFRRPDCDLDLTVVERQRLELCLWFREGVDAIAQQLQVSRDAVLWDDYLTWVESIISLRLMEIGPVESPWEEDEDDRG